MVPTDNRTDYCCATAVTVSASDSASIAATVLTTTSTSRCVTHVKLDYLLCRRMIQVIQVKQPTCCAVVVIKVSTVPGHLNTHRFLRFFRVVRVLPQKHNIHNNHAAQSNLSKTHITGCAVAPDLC